MEAYITTITLEIDGELLEDFNSFTEKGRVKKKLVKLMNGHGTTKVTASNLFSLDYVIPADKTEFDFDGLEDATVTVDYENGTRISFGGCEVLSIGEAKFDGDKEVTKNIEFAATTRTVE